MAILKPHYLILGKIKENRRLAVWHEKDALFFLSFIVLAAIKLYLC
ncbi:hypothetical protein [Candidatus Tisiphia endosymbiont of Mystacides longicornis]